MDFWRRQSRVLAQKVCHTLDLIHTYRCLEDIFPARLPTYLILQPAPLLAAVLSVLGRNFDFSWQRASRVSRNSRRANRFRSLFFACLPRCLPIDCLQALTNSPVMALKHAGFLWSSNVSLSMQIVPFRWCACIWETLHR